MPEDPASAGTSPPAPNSESNSSFTAIGSQFPNIENECYVSNLNDDLPDTNVDNSATVPVGWVRDSS